MFIVNQNKTKCVEVHSVEIERYVAPKDMQEYLDKTQEVVEKYETVGLLINSKLESALKIHEEELERKAYYYLMVNGERFGICKKKEEFIEILNALKHANTVSLFELK